MKIRIRPEEIDRNVFQSVGKQWMLITAASGGSVNAMTASWGGMGVLWNKPVALCVIRPQRHTFTLMEAAERYTLSFLPEDCRDAYNLCGSKSGRDLDKIAAAGLTPMPLEGGAYGFEQADLTVACRKLYADMLKPECFIGSEEIGRWYPERDFHKMYIGEITEVLLRQP